MTVVAVQSIDERQKQTEQRVRKLLSAIPHEARGPELLIRRRESFALAAYEKVSSEGYAMMNVGEVARLAGVDKRTMYDYIGDKQDLLYLVFLHFLPRQLAAMAEGVRRGVTPEDCIRNMVSAHMDYLDEMNALALIYYRELRHLNRQQITEVLGLIREVIGAYEDVIRWGIDEGEFKAVNPHLAARVAAAAVDMKAVARWDLHDEDDQEIKETVITMILRGLGVDR